MPSSQLTTREAITDTLYQAAAAFDHNDYLMLAAVTSPDITMEVRDRSGNVHQSMAGLDVINDGVFKRVGPMDTTHMLSNFRIQIQNGESAASLTCYALAQHCPAGKGGEQDGPKYLVGGEYMMDLVKGGDDTWKIKKWVLIVIWSQGDGSVMAG